jgi:amino acid transporter
MTARPVRQLTLVDCFGLGINGIIGSGIFLLPAALQRRAGGQSPLAWLAVGSLCTLIALCFAEASSRTDRSGGPYRYAVEAFGPVIGFAVGWITMVSSLLGYAAVARGFAEHAAFLVGGGEAAAVVVVVTFLAIVNIIGIKASARTGDAISVIKVVGLLLFVGVGLFFVRGANLHAPPSPEPGEAGGLFAAAFAGLFACTGFEDVPVPAGETVDPRRSIGLSMVVSVVGATLLYALVQTVAMGTLPSLGQSTRPLVDAARTFAGRGGADAIAVIAALSALGFCAGSAIVVPRYVETFAQDAFLPRILATRSPRFGTPVASIVVVSIVTAALGATLDFDRLADVSNVAVVAQYISTCSSILVWRTRDPEGARFRLPFGPLIPILSIIGSVLFLFHVSRVELVFGAALLVGGLAFGLVTRFFRRGRVPAS